MARRLPVKSGQDVLKTFHRVRERFQLTIKRIKGGHAILHNGYCRHFNVPLHNELKKGTLLDVIEHAGMTKEEFLEHDP